MIPAFLRRLPVTLLVGLAVWWIARPALDRAVGLGAQLLLRATELPPVTRIVVADHRAQIRRADFTARSAVPAFALTSKHANLVVLLALFLAVPRPFDRRGLKRLGLACAILYLAQCVHLTLHVKYLYATGLGEPNPAAVGAWSAAHYSDLARGVYGYLRLFADLPGRFATPFLIWLVLSWSEVQALLEVSGPGEGTGSRGSRTPSSSRSGRRERG